MAAAPSFSLLLLLFEGRSICMWMILTAHHSPVLHAVAFMTVANVPRPSSCAMSYFASMQVSSFGVRCR